MNRRSQPGDKTASVTRSPLPFAALLISTSAVLIAFEFLIVRLFSYLYWGDFGYFSIAVAMFGFSLSGVAIAYLRARNFTFSPAFLGIITALTSLAVYLSPILLEKIPFQPVLIFHSAGEFFHLLGFGGLLAAPFLAGYFLIGVLLTQKIEKIGFYYCLNLGGAALGGLIFTFALTRFSFPVQTKVLAVLLLVPLFFLPGRKKLFPFILAAGIIVSPFPPPVPSDFKDIAAAENVPEYTEIKRDRTPYGIVTVLSSPYFRSIPGLSLNYSGALAGQYRYFQNGDGRGRLPLSGDLSRLVYLEYLPSSLPYLLRDFDRHLYLSTGGGEAWLKAFYFGDGEAVVAVADPSLRQTARELIRGRGFYGIDPAAVRLIGAGDHLISFITVLTVMLVGAGAGSWLLAPRVKSRRGFLLLSLVFLLVFFLPLNFFLELGGPAAAYPGLHLVLLALFGLGTAVSMGVYFPRGMSMAGRKSPLAPAWMWSFSGLASVIAPVAATVISIRLGVAAVTVLILVLYVTATIVYLTQSPGRRPGYFGPL